MSKTKTPAELPAISQPSSLIGLDADQKCGQVKLTELATLLTPLVLTAKVVKTLEETQTPGVFRLGGDSEETLRNGLSLRYAMVLSLGMQGDIYQLILGYPRGAVYRRVSSNGYVSETILGE